MANDERKRYMNEYISTKIRYRRIHFNVDDQDDMKLLEWVDKQPEKIAPYLKRLIREDMDRKEQKQ